jgi:8-oxo-dGTP pyrophosphatase MutT (NUDIX family)
MTQHEPHHRDQWLRQLLLYLADHAPRETGHTGQPIDLAHLTRYDAATNGYLIGWIDMLAYLGMLRRSADEATVQIVSVQAGYMLRMLVALLDMRVPLIADWDSEGITPDMMHPFAKGVDLLAAAERRRLEVDPHSSPLRTVESVIGLIAQEASAGQRRYLLSWDEPAQQWQFVGGRTSVHDVSLQAALLREMTEELACAPLVEGVHVHLSRIGEPFTLQRVSPTYGMLSSATFHAFAVGFLGPLPRLPADTRWVSEAEIWGYHTADGQPIASRPFCELVEQAGIDLDQVYGKRAQE